ncbi:MAG: GrpB family protein [Bacteroidota bacterium]|nr:GrpB family protein [Bacteroidota bacterium]MDP4230720.1 GrpB family protein [Bacteroidota bacterium]MDP4237540.1 GrpB family protein [Bacteroidota bacterium]
MAFEAERLELMEAIGHYVADIQHIGSTSVRGLAAKPIVDILIGLRRLLDAQDCIMPIEALGYEYVPEYESVFPERRYFRKSTNGKRTHHIHMVELGSDFWKRHILFRDELRSDPIATKEYESLKRSLAVTFENDREGYTDGKTDFIEGILRRSKK